MATTSSALLKTILHKALAEGVYKDITNRTSQYYYFLGKTIKWTDETSPPVPFDSVAYENETRNQIITMKQITPSDVSFVIPRFNWNVGEIYDMYDDRYSTEIIGLNVISGGSGYTTPPTITITGGGGSGAKFYPIVYEGEIIGIEDNDYLVSQGVIDASNGSGYISQPTVTVTGGGGSGAIIEAVLNIAPSGTQKLEDAKFYVMTEDFNVYKCLDNNNNSKSTSKPLGTSVESITTDDGYVWKYMYTVPINLRSKFFSDQYIPVVSALTNQIYSNGTVDNIIINNKGTGYTYANINVTGDGYVESDQTLLSGLSIVSGGTGYTAAQVVFGDPFTTYTNFAASTSVFISQVIKNSTGDFYKVQAPGTLGTSQPTHRYGVVTNGTAALKYIGTTVKGTVTVSGGAITGFNLDGGVYDIVMSNGGGVGGTAPYKGYNSAPNVYFSGSGTGATAQAKLYNGSVVYSTITNQGSGYTTPPTVTFGEVFPHSTAVYVGQQFYYGNNLYTVTASGTTHATTNPTSTGSTPFTNGTATLVYSGSRATGTATLRYGAGYTFAPSITITGTGGGSGADASWLTSKSNAKLLPVIDNGQIVQVIVKEPGIGYSNAVIEVTGDGKNAEIVADLSVGSIQSLQANNEILVTEGTINAIKVISGGYGYGVANVIIEGDGTGCEATTVLDSATGAIKKVVITKPGSGYTYANISIEGNGKAAKLRAIIAPYGGHGKNSPDELFATTLMFYSNVSTDLNQGLSVNNDYRQVGIIKNPRRFEDSTRFNNNIGSACFLVQGSFNTSNFPSDTDVVVTRITNGVSSQKLYRLVTVTSSAALIQSLDNDVPQINDTFKKASDNTKTFTVLSVANPTVDKYSGQMMFIDNKAGFTPSADETVTLRTVIKF